MHGPAKPWAKSETKSATHSRYRQQRDGAGPVEGWFLLAPGLVDELLSSLILLRRLPDVPSWVLADMACDARVFRSDVRVTGAIPVVPSRRGTKQPERCPDYIYQHHHLIERCWSWLKERLAIATR